MAVSARITKGWGNTGVSSLPRAAEAADMSGRLVGSYRLTRLIGQGGMGAVYEAAHQQLPRRVAVKMLNPEFASDADLLQRFFNEARAVNIVQHPDIVSISELGQLADGSAYLVMELLLGEPLSLRMHRVSRLPLSDAVRLGRQIASALAAAHAKGIVHRDLKPDNVMIVADADSQGGERAKLLDFGIAKLAEEHQGVRQVKTRAGVVLGTPVYMSPEQCRGAAEVDHKADVYSLGIMLYQMLAGEPPFQAEGEGELVAMHIYEEPTPLRERVPLVPEDLSAFVQRMLDKDRQSRPSMAEVAAQLERWSAARPSGALPMLPLDGPQVALPLSQDEAQAPRLRTPSPRLPHSEILHGPVASAPSRPRAALPVQALLLGAAILSVLSWQALRRPKVVNEGKVVLASPPQRIRWTVLTEPPGADIVRVADGKVLSRTPFREERVAAQGSLPVVLRRRGYAPKHLELDLSANVMVQEVLFSVPASAPPPAEPRRSGKVRARVRPPAIESAPVPPSAPQAPPQAQEVEDFERVSKPKGPDGRNG